MRSPLRADVPATGDVMLNAGGASARTPTISDAGCMPRLPDVSVASAVIATCEPGAPADGTARNANTNGARRSVNVSTPFT